jgi:hypothetical protein
MLCRVCFRDVDRLRGMVRSALRSAYSLQPLTAAELTAFLIAERFTRIAAVQIPYFSIRR